MTDVRLMGVSKSVRHDQIRDLSDAEQDDLIREIGNLLEVELREFVKGAPHVGDLVYEVQGPYDDPLQGKVYVHTMAGNFDLDRLDHSSQAYITHVTNPDDSQPALDIRVPNT